MQLLGGREGWAAASTAVAAKAAADAPPGTAPQRPAPRAAQQARPAKPRTGFDDMDDDIPFLVSREAPAALAPRAFLRAGPPARRALPPQLAWFLLYGVRFFAKNHLTP